MGCEAATGFAEPGECTTAGGPLHVRLEPPPSNRDLKNLYIYIYIYIFIYLYLYLYLYLFIYLVMYLFTRKA